VANVCPSRATTVAGIATYRQSRAGVAV